MQAKAIVFTNVNEVDLVQTNVPDPGPGELLIEAAYTCISPGTELRTLAGKQVGAAPWPLIPGYSCAGTVIKVGPDTTISVGTTVFYAGTSRADHARTWGAHISHAVQAESRVFVLPDGVDLVEASMAKLAAIAYQGLRLAVPLPHEKVAVVGLGPIGQLSARMFALAGAHVIAGDLSAARVGLAERGGATGVVVSDTPAAAFAPHLPHGADIVVDATGVPAVLPTTIPLAKALDLSNPYEPNARLLVQGSYPDDFSIPYQPAFHKRLTFLMPRDQQALDLQAVLDLLGRKRLVLRDLISDVRPPEAAPDTYTTLRTQKEALLTVAFDWRH